MNFEKVESSQIHSMHHDGDSTMAVRFSCSKCRGAGKAEGSEFGCERCSGQGHTSTYLYQNVPAEKYVLVRDDPESVGKAFHRHIKSNPTDHPFTRIS